MKQNIGGLKFDILSFEVTGNLKKKKTNEGQQKKLVFNFKYPILKIRNIHEIWDRQIYWRWSTIRFESSKNIERKTITGRVAGEAAKVNSYFRMKYWKYAVCHYLNYRKQAMGNYWKSNIVSGRVGAETAKSGF